MKIVDKKDTEVYRCELFKITGKSYRLEYRQSFLNGHMEKIQESYFPKFI
ncbi:hypothetical protein Q2T46_15660 [Thermoanaerobacterium sp. CMT5567-10]|nr:hypothetical protein [Thermoanaerobacterium sp. CMT5567-10]WLY85457.1 hypothetical protein Q2T46_15660 [Thermoanaerobacterium sp. CMT5567-10]